MELCRVLLQGGASVEVVSSGQRATPLHLAAGMAYEKVLRLLLRHQARPTVRDADRHTPRQLVQQMRLDDNFHNRFGIVTPAIWDRIERLLTE